jgi:hypothetical protein
VLQLLKCWCSSHVVVLPALLFLLCHSSHVIPFTPLFPHYSFRASLLALPLPCCSSHTVTLLYCSSWAIPYALSSLLSCNAQCSSSCAVVFFLYLFLSHFSQILAILMSIVLMLPCYHCYSSRATWGMIMSIPFSFVSVVLTPCTYHL